MMLTPFLPNTAQRIWDIFGFRGKPDEQSWEDIGSPPKDSINTAVTGPEYLFDLQKEEKLLDRFRNLRRRDQEVLKKIGEYCEIWRER
jgi:methionyl-tRNA synthetase